MRSRRGEEEEGEGQKEEEEGEGQKEEEGEENGEGGGLRRRKSKED